MKQLGATSRTDSVCKAVEAYFVKPGLRLEMDLKLTGTGLPAYPYTEIRNPVPHKHMLHR